MQLKVYVSTQWSRSSWTAADLQYKGYSNNCGSDWTLVEFLITISVLTVALTTIVLIKAAPKLYQKLASNVEKDNQWYSFFWAASFMASLCDFALLPGESMGFLFYYNKLLCSYPQNALIMNDVKAVMIYLLLPLDILVAIRIHKNEEFPIPYLAYILSFPLCCTCCCCSCCRRSKQLRSK